MSLPPAAQATLYCTWHGAHLSSTPAVSVDQLWLDRPSHQRVKVRPCRLPLDHQRRCSPRPATAAGCANATAVKSTARPYHSPSCRVGAYRKTSRTHGDAQRHANAACIAEISRCTTSRSMQRVCGISARRHGPLSRLPPLSSSALSLSGACSQTRGYSNAPAATASSSSASSSSPVGVPKQRRPSWEFVACA